MVQFTKVKFEITTEGQDKEDVESGNLYTDKRKGFLEKPSVTTVGPVICPTVKLKVTTPATISTIWGVVKIP